MKNVLDIKRLRYFKAIAESGSLSGAARALNIAQPALSYHLAELEKHVGTPLVERRRNGVALTQAGRLLQRHATEIVAKVERAETELSRIGRERGGKTKMRVALISSLAADLTPVLLKAISGELPDLVLRITESRTLDSSGMLDRGEADLAIHLSPAAEGEVPLAEEQLFFVTAGRANRRPITFTDVAAKRLVLPALGNPLRAFLEEAAAKAGLALDVSVEIEGTEPRRNAVLAGLGGTILGAHSVQGAGRLAGLAARPIVEPALFRPIFLGARRGLDPQLVGRMRAILGRALAGFGDMEVRLPDNAAGARAAPLMRTPE